jgi:hypothetical protein
MSKGKPKSFTDHLNERLDRTEIQRLQEAAHLEQEYCFSLKQELNEAVRSYMEKNSIGMCKMADMLCCSDARAMRIISGEKSFTMATVAHIGAAMGLKPHIVFEEDK